MMRTLKMRNKEYFITKNNNEYDLGITPENVLILGRGQETYYRIDLDKGCFGANVGILKILGIEIETVPMPGEPGNKQVIVVPIYNPQKEWIGNISIDKKTLEIEDNLKCGYTITKEQMGETLKFSDREITIVNNKEELVANIKIKNAEQVEVITDKEYKIL